MWWYVKLNPKRERYINFFFLQTFTLHYLVFDGLGEHTWITRFLLGKIYVYNKWIYYLPKIQGRETWKKNNHHNFLPKFTWSNGGSLSVWFHFQRVGHPWDDRKKGLYIVRYLRNMSSSCIIHILFLS